MEMQAHLSSPRKQSTCVCCEDASLRLNLLPCGHLYCKECLRTMFEMSLKDRSLIPVKCCKVDVDLGLHLKVLKRDDQQAYADALEEAQVKCKMYW